MSDRPGGLLAWQWALYQGNHTTRANLAVHAVTNPMFLGGTVAALATPLFGIWLLGAGIGAMALAMALQGRTHRGEATPPVPFQGPGDVVARIFVEQWVTFPRYVLSGSFARAWRESRAG